MNGNLIWLIVALIVGIISIAGANRGKAVFKPLVSLSVIAVIAFGFLWHSWLGAIGSLIVFLLLAKTLVGKRSLD